jgi:hypothetical protein
MVGGVLESCIEGEPHAYSDESHDKHSYRG